MEYTRPVVLDETQSVIVIKDPFRLGLDFCVLDLAGLLLNSAVVKTGQETNLDENPAKEREIVVVAEADHATQRILLIILTSEFIQVGYVKDLWNRNERF